MATTKRRVVRGARPQRTKKPAPPAPKSKIHAALKMEAAGGETQQVALAERLDKKRDVTCVWAYLRAAINAPQVFASQRVVVEQYCKDHQLGEPEFVEEISAADQPIISDTLMAPDITASSASPRPLLLMLLGHISARPSTNLVVYQLERLSPIALEQEVLLDILKRKGVVVHSTQTSDRDIIAGGPSRDEARQGSRCVLQTLTQYEREIVKFRMRTGQRIKKARGEWLGGGKPFGYDVVDGALRVNVEQAALVRWIFYWRDQFAYSYDQIVKAIAKKFGFDGWHKVRVLRVIANRGLYEGVYKPAYSSISHKRDDLRILPVKWADWVKENAAFKGTIDEQA